MKGFEGYKFDVGEQEDPSWNQYLNVLYPSLEDLERIANMDLLDALVKRGDVLTIPREVQHWASFRNEQSRALFREAARGAGYGIVGETESEGEFPFGMSVTRTQKILGERQIGERLRIFADLINDGIADDSDYLQQLGIAEEVEALADGVFTWPEMASHGFADHGDWSGICLVEIVEGSSAHQRNTQCVEKAG